MIARGSDYGDQYSRVVQTESVPSKPPTNPPTPSPTKKPTTNKPTAKPTSTPTGLPKRGPCDNRIGWRFDNNPAETCDAMFRGDISSQEAKDKCNLKDPIRDRRVKHFCPSYCRKKCKVNNQKTDNATQTSQEKMNGKMMNGNAKRNPKKMARTRYRKPIKRRQNPETVVSI